MKRFSLDFSRLATLVSKPGKRWRVVSTTALVLLATIHAKSPGINVEFDTPSEGKTLFVKWTGENNQESRVNANYYPSPEDKSTPAHGTSKQLVATLTSNNDEVLESASEPLGAGWPPDDDWNENVEKQDWDQPLGVHVVDEASLSAAGETSEIINHQAKAFVGRKQVNFSILHDEELYAQTVPVADRWEDEDEKVFLRDNTIIRLGTPRGNSSSAALALRLIKEVTREWEKRTPKISLTDLDKLIALAEKWLITAILYTRAGGLAWVEITPTETMTVVVILKELPKAVGGQVKKLCIVGGNKKGIKQDAKDQLPEVKDISFN